MSHRFDYTRQARDFTFRNPLLSYVGIQINFWMIAYALLITIIHLSNLSLIDARGLDITLYYLPALGSAVFIGIIYGLLLGIIDFRLDQRLNKRLSLGILILIRSAIYGLVFIFIMFIFRYLLWEQILAVYFYDPSEFRSTNETWKNLFLLFGLYTIVLSPSISFINQVNRKFGPGVLLPMLLGKYRTPLEEDRLFMLLDMKSSTTHAEVLGHKKYSLLVQDCFHDMDDVIMKYQAEIYQYVGDEIVVTWLKISLNDEEKCLDFFFDCQRKFQQRSNYYEQNYGFVPLFKAGVHRGPVMAVEVGTIKREIAYHGDTINTAARIQSVCNSYGKIILISHEIAETINTPRYKIVQVGEIELKGKSTKTKIYSAGIVDE